MGYSRSARGPFDVKEVRPDFLVTSTYKWLLGPYGFGFMHVGEQRA